jgi:hypothetical protein
MPMSCRKKRYAAKKARRAIIETEELNRPLPTVGMLVKPRYSAIGFVGDLLGRNDALTTGKVVFIPGDAMGTVVEVNSKDRTVRTVWSHVSENNVLWSTCAEVEPVDCAAE